MQTPTMSRTSSSLITSPTLVDLGLVAKQVHWTVTGPASGPCTCSSTRSSRPPAGTVATGSRLIQAPDGWQNDRDIVAYFIDAYAKVIAEMRERINEVAYTDPSPRTCSSPSPPAWESSTGCSRPNRTDIDAGAAGVLGRHTVVARWMRRLK